jgi:outer membrane protein OmpA-like peptidoglycan-associated protein
LLFRQGKYNRKWEQISKEDSVKSKSATQILNYLYQLLAMVLIASAASAAATNAKQIPAGQKTKAKGKITARSGDRVYITDVKDGSTVAINVTDNTKVERKKGKYEFFRHNNMDVTAMVPGLTIEAEGVGNAKGQLDASKISFYPDTFAIEVAEEQQIMSNKAATSQAQSTANQGVANAAVAQQSANQAQASADTAQATAALATEGAVVDAAAIETVNKRVSDLGDYQTVAESGIYFPKDGTSLDAAAKADLDTLAAALNGGTDYMIEVAGYASSTGSKQLNQKLSENRAAAVVDYLRSKGNIPMRRFLVPAGYGANHPADENTDAQGRALNRRVDVKVLVNKGLAEGM